MKFLVWLTAGIVTALAVRRVVAVEGPSGLAGDLIVAAAGALLGGWFVKSLAPAARGINIWSVVAAFALATVLLMVLRLFAQNRAAR